MNDAPPLELTAAPFPLLVVTEEGAFRYEAEVAFTRDEWLEMQVEAAASRWGLGGVLDVLLLQHAPTDIIAALAGLLEPEPDVERWRLPVGEGEYPAPMWYVASRHRPGSHIGLDINLDRYERGDVERRLGLHVFAMTDGIVEHVDPRAWDNGTDGVIVIRHTWRGVSYYVRYAHLANIPWFVGAAIVKGDTLGTFADWSYEGDHLHLDIALSNPGNRYSVNGVAGIDFVDPEPLLRDACGDAAFQAMYDRWTG